MKNSNTHPGISRRKFVILAGTAAFLLSGGLNAEDATERKTVHPRPSGNDILCRNPAYRVFLEDGLTYLGTTTKGKQRIRFGVDVGGLAVWNVLSGPDEIEAQRGRTVDQIVETVMTAFPDLAASRAREGVREFLAQAIAAGIVFRTDKEIFCRARTNQNITNSSP